MHTVATRHSEVAVAPVLPAAEFIIGEWLVEPDLNRVSSDGRTLHVRPQLMDLLVYLARNTGRTLPHDELMARVWPNQPFITPTALPRCIAELRQALGDRAGSSHLIQTIPKRGYRLIAPVGPASDALSFRQAEASSGSRYASAHEPAPEPPSQPAPSPAQPSRRRLLGWSLPAGLPLARRLATRLAQYLGLQAG